MSVSIRSSDGIVQPSGSDPWATVRNLVEKTCGRPNRDRPLSIQPLRDSRDRAVCIKENSSGDDLQMSL